MENKEEVKEIVRTEVTQMFEIILNSVQLVCASDVTYKLIRSKILRCGNDCIRNINSKIDKEE